MFVDYFATYLARSVLMRAFTRKCCAALAVVLGLIQASPAMAAEYRFSPVNQYGIKLTAEYWNPIIDYVSEKSGVKLVLKIGRTSADTTAYVLAQEVEFVFSNHLFSPEREKLGWRVTARRNAPPIRGQIVVPAESSVRELTDLNGQEVAFAGPEALVGYKFPYAHLLSRNIDARPVFAGNMDAAFSQMFSGRVKASGANSQLIEGYAKREGRPYRVIWSSEPLHDLALMVGTNVPEADARAVTQAFINMDKDPRGRDILAKSSQAVGLPVDANFIPTDGREYAAYRTFYRTVPASLR
jgi:phosphonate transport system substrate-binding protein